MEGNASQQQNRITQQVALNQAMGAGNHHADPARGQEIIQQRRAESDIGFGL